MPELPEVETIVATLRPHLVGRAMAEVRLFRPDVLHPRDADLSGALVGRVIVSIDRRGKKILMRLEGGGTFLIHLGMSGRLTLEDWAAPMAVHTHLILRFAPCSEGRGAIGGELRFRDPRRFGGLWLLPSAVAGDENLGPEPLSLRPAVLGRLLSGTRRAIKSALLDQQLIAGLGNIYADESLFDAGIHPLTPASGLTAEQVGRLNRSIKRILRRAIRSGGSSLRDYVDGNGKAGGFQELHRVYGREGEACAACRMAICRAMVGGRSTHFCPGCQAPVAAGARISGRLPRRRK